MITDRSRLSGTDLDFYPLTSLPETSGLPMTVKVLLEGMLRLSEVGTTNEKSVRALAAWPAKPPSDAELPFLPARVLHQDSRGEERKLGVARRLRGPGRQRAHAFFICGPDLAQPEHAFEEDLDRHRQARRLRQGSNGIEVEVGAGQS